MKPIPHLSLPLCFIWLACFLSSALHPACAQLAPLGVGPMEVDARVPRPGARISGAFNVFNGGDEPLYISAYTSDWSLKADGSPKFDAPGTVPHSCANWIELNPRTFTLPPNGKVPVRYSISTPVDLAVQHHALVFFESRPVPLKGDSKFKINVVTRMGALMFVSPATPAVQQARITGITAGTKPGDEPKMTVENNGTVAVRVKGRVEVRDAAGTTVARADLLPGSVRLLAGSTVDLIPDWKTRPAPGSYTVRFILDYGVKSLLATESILTLTEPAPPEAPAPTEAPASPETPGPTETPASPEQATPPGGEPPVTAPGVSPPRSVASVKDGKTNREPGT
jgi:hypothetical protein